MGQGQGQGQKQAQSIAHSGNASVATSVGGNNSSQTVGGQTATNVVNISEAAQKRAPVNTAYAAPVAIGGGVCAYVPASGGASAIGFSFSASGAIIDKGCETRANADVLARLGYIKQATALLMQNDSVRKAFETVVMDDEREPAGQASAVPGPTAPAAPAAPAGPAMAGQAVSKTAPVTPVAAVRASTTYAVLSTPAIASWPVFGAPAAPASSVPAAVVLASAASPAFAATGPRAPAGALTASAPQAPQASQAATAGRPHPHVLQSLIHRFRRTASGAFYAVKHGLEMLAFAQRASATS